MINHHNFVELDNLESYLIESYLIEPSIFPEIDTETRDSLEYYIFGHELDSWSAEEQTIIGHEENNSNNINIDADYDTFTGSDNGNSNSDLDLYNVEHLELERVSSNKLDELEFIGGFGDFNGEEDLALEIINENDGTTEIYALSGDGVAEIYQDSANTYVIFSDTNETTNVDITAQSNILFGNFVGASLDIKTVGNIQGNSIFLKDADRIEESGLHLESFDNQITLGNISTLGDAVYLKGEAISLIGESVITRGGEIYLEGATTLSSQTDNFMFDSSILRDTLLGGNITFQNTINNYGTERQNLRLQAGTGEITFNEAVGNEGSFFNLRVDSANTFLAQESISLGKSVRIVAEENIQANDINANGTVRLSSQTGLIFTQDVNTDNQISLQAATTITTEDLDAQQLGLVKIRAGNFFLEDDDSGEILTQSINARNLSVESTGTFTSEEEITVNRGLTKITTEKELVTANLVSEIGAIQLTSRQSSIQTQDITSSNNISLQAATTITTENLDAQQLGLVKIRAGNFFLEDDDSGEILTHSITGKAINIESTGSFLVEGDIFAHDGTIRIVSNK